MAVASLITGPSPHFATFTEDPALTPHECFRRISRRLRSVLKRSRIPMVSGPHLPLNLTFPRHRPDLSWSCLGGGGPMQVGAAVWIGVWRTKGGA